LIDLSPDGYEETRRSEAKKTPRQRAARALKTYQRKAKGYYGMRHKWTAGHRRAELERVAQYCQEEGLDFAGMNDGLHILLRLYRAAEARHLKEAAQ